MPPTLSTRNCPPEQAANVLLLASLTQAVEITFLRLPRLKHTAAHWQKIAANSLMNLLTELTVRFDDDAHEGQAELGERAMSAVTVALHLPDDALNEWLADGVRRATAAAEAAQIPANV